jgi:dihydropteroate synthase
MKMEVLAIDASADLRARLDALGCDPGGSAIMAQKGRVRLFRVTGLKPAAANILKQDALAVGADLAVPRGVIDCRVESCEAVLMGTPRQLARLVRKMARQPFGLKAAGEALRAHLQAPVRPPVRLMGVVNANDDSFYPGSRFRPDAAIEAMARMVEEGAAIVDVGAVSSRPGSEPVSESEELARLRPLFEAIGRTGPMGAVLSIDTFRPAVAREALEAGFAIVNDITGLGDPQMAAVAAEYGAGVVIMHMRGEPKTMQHNPHYRDVVAEVDAFFSERIERALAGGVAKEKIILDVGIGFGKRPEHNLTLLRNLEHFRHHGCELLIGASRKSLIDAIDPAPVEARLPGTLAIHLEAVRRGASVVRCHDVAEHRQALALQRAIEEAE